MRTCVILPSDVALECDRNLLQDHSAEVKCKMMNRALNEEQTVDDSIKRLVTNEGLSKDLFNEMSASW